MIFAHPGWLALLILLPILGVTAVLVSRLRRKQWMAFTAPRLRKSLLKAGSPIPRWLALLSLFGACAALIAALARPRTDAGTTTEKTLGRNVMIALDISRSMRVSDVKPDRLSQAKVMIYELMESMPSERIGFIAFAGNAYLYAPLTIDHSAVRETVEQMDETWAPLGGSDIAAAVELATDTLKKTGQKNNALILFSDGERLRGDLNPVIAEAERSGVHIVSIGVGTENGDYVPNEAFPSGRMVDRDGKPVISRLQPENLRKLAEGTKGKFAVAGSGFDIPTLVKSVVEDLDTFEMEGMERKISVEFYQWLVLPAVLFLIASIVAGTRWRGVKAAAGPALLLLMLLPGTARASEASEAKEALENKRHEEAQQAYQKLAGKTSPGEKRARYRLGEATAAYRGGDFRSARSAYSEALLSKNPGVEASGHLGMGNCLFQLGWKTLANERYPEGPANAPDMEKFDSMVQEALSKMILPDAQGEIQNGGQEQIKSLVTNWADAVKHYDSALAIQPKDSSVLENRRMTIAYLKRLEKLLKQEEEDAKQAMPQGQQGGGPPQEGDEGDEGDNGQNPGEEGDGQDGQERPGGSGNGEQRERRGSGGEEDERDGKGKNGQNPNESPEERARRILRENADRENGPLSPGRREFRDAAQDW